jgi:protein-S-isoprenylcysteine O-methyltransferase Ste14
MPPEPTAAAARCCGCWPWLVLMWCGIALRVWGIRTLGGYFTYTVQTRAQQRVIASGSYRVLRHPSYTGLLPAVAGVGLIYANWLALLVIVAAVWAYRITVEEARCSTRSATATASTRRGVSG